MTAVEGDRTHESTQLLTPSRPSASPAGRGAGLLDRLQPVLGRLGSLPDHISVWALTLLALVLRAPNLGRAYWVDEGISIGIASHPLHQLPGLLRRDGSPPLFYGLLHFWIEAFGTSEVATHLLPLLLSLATIPAGYWAGRELYGRRAGLTLAAMMATNPFLAWYSTETRMYPLVVLLGMVGVAVAYRAFRDGSRRDAVWAVLTFALLVYTHNWGLYLVGVTAAVLLGLAIARGDRRRIQWVLCGGLGVLILWLPWVPTFLYQAHNTAAPWAVRPALGDFFADPSTALGGTLGFFVVPVIGIAALVLRRRAAESCRAVAAVVLAIALLTTLAGFLGAEMEPSWTVRYLGVIVGPFLLAVAGVLAASRAGRAVVASVCALLAAWAVVGLVLPNPSARYAKSNVAALADAARSWLGPGDVVVVTQTEQTAVAYHYLPKGLSYVDPTGPVSDPGVVDWRNIVERLQSASACADVAPSIDALPVGAGVLVIDPDRVLGASGTAWSRAANGQVLADDALLAHDQGLTPVAVFDPAVAPRPYSPVDGILYRKTSGQAACR